VWEAMRWARAHGCTVYDPVGYSMTALPGSQLWGINQFKRGFASLDDLTRGVAVHEKICSPVLAAAASAVRRRERDATGLRAGAAGGFLAHLVLLLRADMVRRGASSAEGEGLDPEG
jgi:hypothetical protein